MINENENKNLEKLLSEFPPSSFEEWRKAAEALLKGKPFDKVLLSKTFEGIDLKPIYSSDDTDNLEHLNNIPGFPPYIRSNKIGGLIEKGWGYAQELNYPSYDEFNECLRYDIERGLNTIVLELDEATKKGLDPDQASIGEVGKNGVSIVSISGFTKAFEGIDIQKYPLFIDAGTSFLPFTAILLAYLNKKNIDPAKIKGSIVSDILSILIKNGNLPCELSGLLNETAQLTKYSVKNLPGIKTISVNTIPFHEAGANAIQELAIAASSSVFYLNEMIERGIDINDAASKFMLNFSVSSNIFLEIAKLRAARFIWAKIIKEYGGNEEAQKIEIRAVTSKINKTSFDPYVNMLRTTGESFASVIGGADNITISPFDVLYNLPDEFSRRISRNTHIILQNESSLDKVIDPAGGSWFIESLTGELIKNAWNMFKRIEAEGGILSSIKNETIQKMINDVAEKRIANVRTRKDKIVGINMYADINEKRKEDRTIDFETFYKKRAKKLQELRTSSEHSVEIKVLEKLQQIINSGNTDVVDILSDAAFHGATIGEMIKSLRPNCKKSADVLAIKDIRLAHEFEELRNASLKYKERNGFNPKVFLANMGPVSQHKARADFSSAFFQIAGFEVINNNGFTEIEDCVDKTGKSEAKIVVICSTDETYPELVPSLVNKLKEKDKNIFIVLAGYPKDQIEQHKQSGVDEFIYLGANAYEILSGIMKKTGVIENEK